MRHVAAVLLAVLGGNAAPDAAAVEAIITASGAEVDSERLTALLTELEGKDINELVAAGKSKIASVSIGGGSGGAAAAPAAGAGGAAAPAAEAKKEEEEEEADLSGGMDMFGGGGDADY